MDGSVTVGDYITDTFQIGGISVENLNMAVATQANGSTTGIMGIGLDIDESRVLDNDEAPYPNLPDELYTQGIIGTKAYSIFLDDLCSYMTTSRA